jgi:integrase/recombinase XerD
MKYNARNERIKRDYFILLKEADQMASSTVDGIRKAILRFEEFTRFADLGTFNKEQAIGFKAHLFKSSAVRSGKPLSHATIFTTTRAVQTFFRWLSREPGYKTKIKQSDIRYLNLLRKDVSIATSERTKRVPTLEQIKSVIAACPTETEIDLRNRALIAFTIVTGIRDSAIASLRLKHIDVHRCLVIQEPNEVKTKFSKRIETWFFPVGDELEKIVIEWVKYLHEDKLFGNDDPLFPRTRVTSGQNMCFKSAGLEPVQWASAGQIRQIFKTAFARAGIPYFNPHSFRDTLTIFGEQVCQTPEEFKAWSQNLGHESPLTTFTSYGQVSSHRQGELVRNAVAKTGDKDKLDELLSIVKNMQG